MEGRALSTTTGHRPPFAPLNATFIQSNEKKKRTRHIPSAASGLKVKCAWTRPLKKSTGKRQELREQRGLRRNGVAGARCKLWAGALQHNIADGTCAVSRAAFISRLLKSAINLPHLD